MSQKQVARREISECVGLIVLALIAPGIGVGMSGLVGTVDIEGPTVSWKNPPNQP